MRKISYTFLSNLSTLYYLKAQANQDLPYQSDISATNEKTKRRNKGNIYFLEGNSFSLSSQEDIRPPKISSFEIQLKAITLINCDDLNPYYEPI